MVLVVRYHIVLIVRYQMILVVRYHMVQVVLAQVVLLVDDSPLAERTPLVLAGEVSEGMFPTVEHGQAVTVARGLVRVPMSLVDLASIEPLELALHLGTADPEVAASLAWVAGRDVLPDLAQVVGGGQISADGQAMDAGIMPRHVLSIGEETLVADRHEGRRARHGFHLRL